MLFITFQGPFIKKVTLSFLLEKPLKKYQEWFSKKNSKNQRNSNKKIPFPRMNIKWKAYRAFLIENPDTKISRNEKFFMVSH
jgi:hypothetical protein